MTIPHNLTFNGKLQNLKSPSTKKLLLNFTLPFLDNFKILEIHESLLYKQIFKDYDHSSS
jgi:hypothetical protein